jgi:hypothetical protein
LNAVRSRASIPRGVVQSDARQSRFSDVVSAAAWAVAQLQLQPAAAIVALHLQGRQSGELQRSLQPVADSRQPLRLLNVVLLFSRGLCASACESLLKNIWKKLCITLPITCC